MSLVIDASVLVAAICDAGPGGRWAESIIADETLFAPDLALVEATNILRRLELARRLTAPESKSALQDLLNLDIRLLPFAPFAERIWALRQNLTSYDAWYVAVAEALDVPLATLDAKLAHASGPGCRFLLPDSSPQSP